MKLSFPTVACFATLLLSGLFFSSGAQAQTDYSARKASSRLSIGAGAALGVALPAGVTFADSSDAAPGVSYRLSVDIHYPLTRSFAAFVSAGIDNRGIGKRPKGKNDNLIYRGNYFFIEPGVSFSAFRLSVNIGLPTGLSEPQENATGVAENRDYPGEHLHTLIEPRVGGILVLMDTKDAWLGLQIGAGFALNKFYADEFAIPDDIPSAKMFSAHLGLTYQFAIPGTGGL
jgi:hypothetical protein